MKPQGKLAVQGVFFAILAFRLFASNNIDKLLTSSNMYKD